MDEDEQTKSGWVAEAREHWGERPWMESFAREVNPDYARDPRLMDWFVWMQRAAVSPNGAAEFTRMQLDTDIGDVLPTVKVPTLVAYPSGQGGAACRSPTASPVPQPCRSRATVSTRTATQSSSPG